MSQPAPHTVAAPTGRLLSDEPTLKDSLDRERLVEAMADLIGQAQTPFVVAVYGPWGSGKTSFLLQLRQRLDPLSSEFPAPPGAPRQRAVTSWFDPWEHSADDNPAVGMLHAIRRDRRLEDRDEVRRAIRAVASVGLSEIQVPFLGVKLSSFGKAFEAQRDADFDRRAVQARLRSHFAAVVDAALEDQPRETKLVVFIDDLDRCKPQISVAVLESIKLFFNLDRCVFVLGVDRGPLEAAIAEEYDKLGIAKETYLDKIVQLPFVLPAVTRTARADVVASLLASHLHECTSMITAAAADNPRRLKRIINSLVVHDRLARTSDFGERSYQPQVLCGLILTQLAAPELFAHIRRGSEIPDADGEVEPAKASILFNLQRSPTLPTHVSVALSGSEPREGLRAGLALMENRWGADVDLEPYLTFAEATSSPIPPESTPDTRADDAKAYQARETAERQQERYERASAADPTSVSALISQASNLIELGRPRDARAAFHQADALARSTDADPSLLALVYRGLARAETELGDLEAAIEHARQAADLYAAERGPESRETNRALEELGILLGKAGRHEEAISLLERVRASAERLSGGSDPDALRTRSNLAALTLAIGDVGGALQQFRDLLAAYEQILGPDHPETLGLRRQIASLDASSDPELSVALLTELLADYERILGADHPDTLDTRSLIASAVAATGDLESAGGLLKALLDDYERVLGPDHPATAATREALASLEGEPP